ncbi:type II glyceraldehyde-3-phosphate dehydrogenase [Salinarchaeum laminariae]|mgnify:CR=1 FL=1|uniref:type II glyceraldehyde-3-phosphate dehydrogenase n=1 Tax=Salinarchaeum laminariae TaxID=869888 RepID=UPI0020C14EF4|nr:type II glyceraldehyde-3-phosphate dehydrogenase [Salinarchaeum laminariae]
MVGVGVNGYGTIGKRVADAIATQPDMDVVGVAKRSPDAGARSALSKGFSVYAPAERADRFDEAGIPLSGPVESLIDESDVIVDATPGGVGEQNAPQYAARDTPAIFQGAERHDVADASFVARANFDDAIGADRVRVVSCNTTGLARLLAPLDDAWGVERARVTLVRRGGDPAQPDRGPIDDILPDPIEIPSHHGPDVRTVLPDVDVDTMGVTVPATRMHLHAVSVTLDEAAPDLDEATVRDRLAAEPRLFLVPGDLGVESCGGLKEIAKDADRPRGDVWENCVWADSISVSDGEISCFQAIHQEADVVPENVDAVRAVTGLADADRSRRMTNVALGLDDRPVGPARDVREAGAADD